MIKESDFLNRLATADELLTHTKLTSVEETTQSMITAMNNTLCMKNQRRKILSVLMDKRYVFHDGILTLPHGHKALRPILKLNESKLKEADLLTDEHIRELIRAEMEVIRTQYIPQ